MAVERGDREDRTLEGPGPHDPLTPAGEIDQLMIFMRGWDKAPRVYRRVFVVLCILWLAAFLLAAYQAVFG